MTTDPIALFEQWLADARVGEPHDAEAMALATADAGGNPSLRMVLLKGHGPDGFIFYTNERSAKARDLAENPSAALMFHWKSIRRQVRIDGPVEPVSPDEADSYFATRSRDSQLGAWASDQSSPLESMVDLAERFEEMSRRFRDGPVPRPPHWSGFRVMPRRIEFWSDRPSRLHERRVFTRREDGWNEGLLYP